ncbi:acetolactate synthase 2 catalytic subunit, partial [Pseudoalteromonas piscicida]
NPDVVSLAAVFVSSGQSITHSNQVDDAVDAIVIAQGPYILHACIDYKDIVWTLVPPGDANDELMTESLS